VGKILDQNFDFRNDHGAVTSYNLRVFENEQGQVAFVVSDLPDNRGPSVRDISPHLARDLAGPQDLQPHQVTWYQHLPDDTLREMTFRHLGNDPQRNPGPDLRQFTPEQLTQHIQNRPEPEWVVAREQIVAKEEVMRRLDVDTLETPLSYEAAQREAMRTLETPQGVSRESVSAAERAQLQQQVEQRSAEQRGAEQPAQQQQQEMSY
jgi:hypothetical protein